MTVLHLSHIPDHGKAEHGVYITDMVCSKCGKALEVGDGFVTEEKSFIERGEYIPCSIVFKDNKKE